MIEVVAAALIDRDGHVLMQQRRADRQHGGLWEFPGGKVEPHETAIAALIREIDEELALQLKVEDLVWLARAGSPAEGLVISLYTSFNWRGEPQCLDAAAIGWFAPGELAALPMPPLDCPLAEALKAMLESR
jgi:8-oxo-dGTP diphosphatase